MSNLIPFNYNEKQIRVIEKDGEPWWILRDVCEVLEISNPGNVAARIDEEDKAIHQMDTLGGKQNVTAINESGLYNVILRSDKPEAKQFKRWITHEVIPTIRKHGAYMTPETIEKAILNPDFVIDLAQRIKEEQQKRLAAEKKLEEQKPLVLFAETCIASNDSLLVREVAKLASKNGVTIGEKRLWQKLREWEVVNKNNEPYQRAFDAGWFEVKRGTYNTPYGSEAYSTYKVTPKGQVYIIEKLKREYPVVA